MFGGLFQPTHLILILVVVLIVFGPGKLPEAAKAMGKAMREMRSSFAGGEEAKEVVAAADTTATTATKATEGNKS